MALDIQEQVPLAPRTTFELGGPARDLAVVHDDAEAREALSFATDRGLPVLVLGGGSNLVVGDAGFGGLVLDVAGHTGVRFEAAGDDVEVTAQAGENWDALVAAAVQRDLAGIECLSGIPGLVGATPIQNVGAYGQEVAETIRRVRAIDRREGRVVELDPAACEFSYRHSMFKDDLDRFVVVAVTFGLRSGGAPALRYGELERAFVAESAAPSLSRVRDVVIELRRQKSMVLDARDENRRSAGSFFTNPIVSEADAARVVALAVAEGIVDDPASVPRYPASGGRVKLAAGWLIERAGIPKGLRRGQVGISTRHALGLVHHGGGTTEALLDLAREVRDTVEARFGVTLVPEPRLVGCAL